MRAFIAIDMPDPQSDALGVLQQGLPVGTLSPRQNLHLTLAFLGEQTDAALEGVDMALSGLVRGPFELTLQGVGCFGGDDPKVVFAGLSPAPELDRLHAKLRSLLHGQGVMLDRSRFRPHVTLARIRGRLSAQELQRLRGWLVAQSGFAAAPFDVAELVLYRSILSRGPAVHQELARYTL